MKKVRDGYKITELGEIPSDWNIMKLSEVAEIVMGQSPDSSSYNDTEDGVAFFQGKTEFGRINPVVKKWCNNPTKISKPLDILISVRAPVGDVNINNIEACIGRGLGAIRATSSSNYKYLYYAIQKYNNQLKKASQGSTFEAINSNDLKGLKLPIPHIDEQEKIALILSNVDEQIDNVDALIEKNKELKKGLMQTLLTKGIGHTKFKKTEIGEIPEEWEVKQLGDIAQYINGKAFKPSEWDTEGLPIVRIQNLNGANEFNYYNGVIDDKFIINKGQLLFSWSGSKGTSFGPFIWNNGKAVLNQHIFKVELNGFVDSVYGYYALKQVTQIIEESAHGSAGLVHVTKGALEKFKIGIPKIQEQRKLASILLEVDEKINVYENKKNKLEMIKKGLIQKLLTGKIRAI